MSIDFAKAKLLLEVVHAAAAAGPGYTNLITMAGNELKAMDDEAAKEIAKTKAEADKKAAAELVAAQAKEAARLKAVDEAAKVQQKAKDDAALKATAAANVQADAPTTVDSEKRI